MFALAGAFAFIVPYGPQTAPDTVISPRPEIQRLARELDFTPWHTLTSRYEMAAAVAHAISNVELAMDDLDGDSVGPAAEVHARMATRSLKVARAYVGNRQTLRRLAKDFRGELKELGADERWISNRLDRLDTRLNANRMHTLFEGDTETLKQTEPEIKRLITAFALPPMSHQPRTPRPMSNWESAVVLNAIVMIAEKAAKDFDQEAAHLAWDGWGSTVDARAAAVQKDLKTVRAMKTHQATVSRLIDTFAYELDKLGVDVREVRQSVRRTADRASHLHAPKPGEAYAPFPDVPQDHWAAKSIQNLRIAGILKGQPDGRFRGN